MTTTPITIEQILTRTAIIEPGMLVRDLFHECHRAQVQALPYIDRTGQLTGRVTLKNVLRMSCLPDHMVSMANMLNLQMSCVDNAETKAKEILGNPVEPYVQSLHKTLDSSAPLIKALATMEQHDTSYIFVVDEGVYKGMITIQGIAAKMTEM